MLGIHQIIDLIKLADNEGTSELSGRQARLFEEKELVEINETVYDQEVSCSMTNLGWITLLKELGYDHKMLNEMWPLLGYMPIADSYPSWKALYRYYERERENEVLQDA